MGWLIIEYKEKLSIPVNTGTKGVTRLGSIGMFP